MVNIDDRIAKMEEMVCNGDYFCINRGRQYGKTTTLSLLKKKLQDRFATFFISFESYGESHFSSIEKALAVVLKAIYATTLFADETGLSSECLDMLKQASEQTEYEVEDFKFLISTICKTNTKPMVLLIDEVDNAGNFQPFVQFLAVLRDMFMFRDERPTFQSVILSGVYDVRNLKLKVRKDEEHQYNSPWNIAVPFEEDLSLPEDGIKAMLDEYKYDSNKSIDTQAVARLLTDYTSGYPYMISRLCSIMSTQDDWSTNGFLEAVKVLGAENNTLFSDTLKKLNDFPELSNMLYNILFCGEEYPYNIANKEQELAKLFDLVSNQGGKLVIANRIYETWLYNKFIADGKSKETLYSEGTINKSRFFKNGKLDMPLILDKFCHTYSDLYKDRSIKFDEDEGRKKFIFFIKPIINGTGNYYVESRTRGLRRTDIVIDYLGKQYIIEMKIWHGNSYNEKGEQQLYDYLQANEDAEGYMLTFNFNKNKKPTSQEVTLKDRTITEFIV